MSESPEDRDSAPVAEVGPTETVAKGLRGRLIAARWPVFVLPFLVYMLANSLEPAPPAAADEAVVEEREEDAPEAEPNWLGLEYRHYPAIYTAKLVVTLLVVALVWPGIREFPFRISPVAVGVGLVGVVVWIGLCEAEWERALLHLAGLDHLVAGGARTAFNPLEEMAETPAWAYAFLAVRFVGLALVVPLIEELLWRGFLMRFIAGSPWWEIPFGYFDGTAVAVTTAMFVVAHPPTEAFAAVSWFLLVTAMMLVTRNLWDCIVAHAVTNFALGVYVVTTDSWRLM